MIRMNWNEKLSVTGNSVFVSICYVLLGAFVSYALFHLFDEYDENWNSKSLPYQILDIIVEIGILAIVSFWASYFIELAPPIFPVRKQLDLLVDTNISSVFYLFGLYLFLDQSLSNKLQYLFKTYFGPTFGHIFPAYGSILDFSLTYTHPRKTD